MPLTISIGSYSKDQITMIDRIIDILSVDVNISSTIVGDFKRYCGFTNTIQVIGMETYPTNNINFYYELKKTGKKQYIVQLGYNENYTQLIKHFQMEVD